MWTKKLLDIACIKKVFDTGLCMKMMLDTACMYSIVTDTGKGVGMRPN